MSPSPAVDVVVPTYRRPGPLAACLDAIASQRHPAARVIVVVRAGDDAGKRAAREASGSVGNLDVVEVRLPGVIAAMAAGVAASSSPLIAFTDDDARPRPDWLGSLVGHFEDSTVGGVGGRDVVAGQEGPLTTSVGRHSGLGRLIANHHLGTGPAREVDFLKGVNMAFRAEALALPAPGVLRGDGAEVDFEILTCAWAKLHGWRLVYDPALLVDHVGAPRMGADQRTLPAPQAIFDAAYNSIMASVLLAAGARRRRMMYQVIVGSSDRPGLLRGTVAFCREEHTVAARLRPSLAGQIAALRILRSALSAPSLLVVTADSLREGASGQAAVA